MCTVTASVTMVYMMKQAKGPYRRGAEIEPRKEASSSSGIAPLVIPILAPSLPRELHDFVAFFPNNNSS
jgi:hypothetical protein